MGKVDVGGGPDTKLMLAFKGIWTENLEASAQMYKLPQQEASFESVKWQTDSWQCWSILTSCQGNEGWNQLHISQFPAPTHTGLVLLTSQVVSIIYVNYILSSPSWFLNILSLVALFCYNRSDFFNQIAINFARVV